MEDRALPHSDEIEKAVIGGLMEMAINQQDINEWAMKLEADDFMNPLYKRIGASIRQILRQGMNVDIITVTEKAKDLADPIVEAMSTIASTANFPTYFKQMNLRS